MWQGELTSYKFLPLQTSTTIYNYLWSNNVIKENIINEFIAQVEKLAEEKMLKTGKLEGSHYAAMKELQRKMNEENND